MRPLVVLLGCLLIGLTFARVSAQTPSAKPVVLVVTPLTGDLSTPHQVHGEGFAPNTTIAPILFDPVGNETVVHAETNDKGSFDLTLSPAGSSWGDGLYRIAVGLGNGSATSATFSAVDGRPHLYAQPYLPSPTAAFNFVGTGLPADAALTVHLWLTGGNLGERDLAARTDAGGNFSIYAWPEELGTPFYPAGQYRVAIEQYGLSTYFYVREHPLSSTIDVPNLIQPNVSVPVSFTHYTPNRALWGVYAGPGGTPGGEFLVGPTDSAGDTGASLSFADLGAGTYYIATPYDWGETTFTVEEPTPTITPTPTATATSTPTPVPTATKRPTAARHPTPTRTATKRPTPTRTPVKKCKKGKNGRRTCKRR